ncbi:MAG: hypothetical protein ACRYF3_10925 [Janthinobacterium lividum]
MGDVDVKAAGEHRYSASLTTAGGSRSEHVVTTDPQLLERLQATRAEEPILVRRLLEVFVAAADQAERDGNPTAVPTLIDLGELDRERPDLLASLPLR